MNYFSQIIRQTLRIIILFSLIILIAHPAIPVHAATERFVSETGGGVACTRAAPCSLTQGLGSVLEDDILYAQAGTYLSGTSGAVNEVVYLDKTFAFLGGWDGGTVGPIIRNYGTSILDAKHSRRVITINGDSTVHPTVNGWTIQNGNASNLPNTCKALVGDIEGCGGGIYVNGAEPIISNNIIRDNVAANAIAAGRGAGGGIYVYRSAGTLIRANEIFSNDAHVNGLGEGGAVYFFESGGKTTAMENEIYRNEDSSTSYFNHSGIAFYVISNTDQIQIYDNDIHDNNPASETYSGVAVLCQYCESNMLIDENHIYDNNGVSAISSGYGNPTIQQNTIINKGIQVGIDLHATDIIPHTPGLFALVANNIIADHTDYNIRIHTGLTEENHTQLIHNTLVDSDYGLYISMNDTSTVSFDRGIISGAGVVGIYQEPGPLVAPLVSHTLFDNNTADGIVGDFPLYGDPLFVDPDVGNFHLQAGSAAINVVTDGGLAEDIDDDDRPNGYGPTPYDVGADEFVWQYFRFLPLVRK
jgi:hypothetical protein